MASSMSCPICDETMHNIVLETDRVFWCPRCGTLKTIHPGHESHQSPAIVKACLRVITAQAEYMADDNQQYPDAVVDLIEQYVAPCVGQAKA